MGLLEAEDVNASLLLSPCALRGAPPHEVAGALLDSVRRSIRSRVNSVAVARASNRCQSLNRAPVSLLSKVELTPPSYRRTTPARESPRIPQRGWASAGGAVQSKGGRLYEVSFNGETLLLTTDREKAKEREELTLLGLEHSFVRKLMDEYTGLDAAHRAVTGRLPGHPDARGVISIWRVEIHGGKGQYHRRVVTLGLNEPGERSRLLERLAGDMRELVPLEQTLLTPEQQTELVRSVLPEMLRRDLDYAGLLTEGASLSSRLLAWVELA